MSKVHPPGIRIRLFGGPRIDVDGVEVARFPTRHGAAILTLLALSPGKRISRDEIADFLWPDEALDASRRRIREHLYQLRNTIPNGRELILSEGDTIWLDGEPFVDALEFERLIEQASKAQQAGEPDERIVPLLTESVALYTGEFAPDLDWPRFDSDRHRYARMHVECLRALTVLLSDAEPERAIAFGLRAVEAEPLNEEAQEDLIRLYARAGRPDESRRQYRISEKLLRTELRREPSREITEFVGRLPKIGPQKPLPIVADGKQVSVRAILFLAFPWERKTRIYGACTALSTALALIILLSSQFWRHSQAQSAPANPEQRFATIRDLSARIRNSSDGNEADRLQRLRADQCIAIGEEAWKAWYGRDEQLWADNVRPFRSDIENTLQWLSTHDNRGLTQLAGALSRYWFLCERPEELRGEYWLHRAISNRGKGRDLEEARALVGLSLLYLLHPHDRGDAGIIVARESLTRYRNINDLWGQAHALRHVALWENVRQEQARAVRDFRASTAIFTQLKNKEGEAIARLCTAYVAPECSHGEITKHGQIESLLSASRLYRDVMEPYGITDLFRTAGGTIGTLNAGDLRQDFDGIEAELREWLKLVRGRHDNPLCREIWQILAQAALKVHRRDILAESLIAFVESTPPTMSDRFIYATRLNGAYLRYRRFDTRSEIDPSLLSRLSMAPESAADKVIWKREFRRGNNMDLEKAVRYAISR